MSVNEKMTAIADAIRDKTGGIQALSLDDMASGVNEVYEAGKKSEYDAFWDSYQNYGDRTNYKYAFAGGGWTEETFKPKYDINCGVAQGIFQESNIKIHLDEYLKNHNLKFIINNTNKFSVASMFAGSLFLSLPILDFSNTSGTSSTFNNAQYLERLHLIVNETTPFNSNTFAATKKLVDVVIEGLIGVSISFSDSPLSVASLKSIITHLKDYSGTENAGKYTLTLKDSCKTLMAEQGAIAELGGKTYDAYIADIGWNLA